MFKVYTFPALGNIIRYIWGHCCQKQVSRACISNYSLQNTVRCDCLFMLYFFLSNWISLQQLGYCGYCEDEHLDFERHFPKIFTHQGLMMNFVSEGTFFLLLQFYYLQRPWIMAGLFQGCILGTFSRLKSGRSPIILAVGAHVPTNFRFTKCNIT